MRKAALVAAKLAPWDMYGIRNPYVSSLRDAVKLMIALTSTCPKQEQNPKPWSYTYECSADV